MRISPDQALKNLDQLAKKEWPPLSEADTRSKIIEPLFKQCLNWQENDFFREEPSTPGFVDYIFRMNERNLFVVEAKKTGVHFKLPVTFGFRRRYKVGGILTKDKNVKEAIQQAQQYCSRKGTRFGIITNGNQYIIFEALRDGEDWSNGNCIIFYNFDDIKRNFTDFWNILSKDAVESGSLIEHLSRKVEELKFVRPVDGIHFRNERQPRNVLNRYMEPIIGHTFTDITDDDKIDLLRSCYVLENEFKQLGQSLRDRFSNKTIDSLGIKEIVQSLDAAGVFEADFYKYAELLKRTPPEPAIFLLLGRIGSGKTTFIFRFFNVVLSDKERDKVKWFYVNFRDAPVDERAIRGYILQSIHQEFSAKYPDLLNDIVTNLKMEKVTPSLEDLTKLFLVLKYEGYVPSLVIDNVDQHKLESSTYHEKVFLEANNLTKELRTITIMTLREESFYRSAIDGPFSAYYIERYEIMPPDLRRVLLFRLNYVLAKLKLPLDELQQLFHTHLDFETRLEDLRDFLEVIRGTIFKSPRRSASRFMSRTSGGNVRRGLELFSRFLISGNTKIKEILQTYRQSGGYTIAEHQFVKSIILGNSRYYSEEFSYLMNIFDFNPDFSKSHFLKLKILNYAEDRVTDRSPAGRGFVSINRLVEEASNLLISPAAIEDCLLTLAKYGLILLNTKSRDSLEGASHFRITECGNYYLRVLPNRFSYVDLVLADTPIADIDLVKRLRRMLPSRALDVRFERVRLFVDYLGAMEKREFQLNPGYRQSPLGRFRFTSKMASSIRGEMRYITGRIEEKFSRL